MAIQHIQGLVVDSSIVGSENVRKILEQNRHIAIRNL
jgi:hypothetical protein